MAMAHTSPTKRKRGGAKLRQELRAAAREPSTERRASVQQPGRQSERCSGATERPSKPARGNSHQDRSRCGSTGSPSPYSRPVATAASGAAVAELKARQRIGAPSGSAVTDVGRPMRGQSVSAKPSSAALTPHAQRGSQRGASVCVAGACSGAASGSARASTTTLNSSAVDSGTRFQSRCSVSTPPLASGKLDANVYTSPARIHATAGGRSKTRPASSTVLKSSRGSCAASSCACPRASLTLLTAPTLGVARESLSAQLDAIAGGPGPLE